MESVEVSNDQRIKSIFSGSDPCVGHAPCPKCHSRDNVGVYQSGNRWCFGCGYFERGGVIFTSAQQTTPTVRKERGIPDDCDNFYGVKVLRWIEQYGITPIDLIRNHVLWSPSREQLIYAFYGASKDELLFWQARNFRDGTDHKRRFFTGGSPEEVVARYVAGKDVRTAVVVEDAISAIKVAKAGYDGLPCFSSHMSKQKLSRIARLYDKVIVWLDEDKFKEGQGLSANLRLIGVASRAMYTEFDPKYYDPESIKDYCNG